MKWGILGTSFISGVMADAIKGDAQSELYAVAGRIEKTLNEFAEQYQPTLTFNSTKFDGNTLTGELTIHGTTKPVSFDVKKIGESKDPWGGYRAGFEAKTVIQRSDFGVSYFIPGVTNKTEIEVYVEGIRQ